MYKGRLFMAKLVQTIKEARKCENLNDPIDNYFWDYIAMFFSRIFIKLHIIPNVITVLSGLVGVAGGILLIFDTLALNIVGVLLICLSVVFDACDGQVARLTKKYSNFGRTLDGLMDSLVYISIYVALCIRLFNVNIPFTNTPWGWWILIPALVSLYFHQAQSRTVDYYKNLHMYMLGIHNELSRSSDIKKDIAAAPKRSFERFRLNCYLSYTKTQEMEARETQKLLNKIEECGGISPSVREAFAAKSNKYVPFTNLLTFNLRSIVLFILLFLPGHAEFYFFPFVIVAIEIARIVIIVLYEKLSKSVLETASFEPVETESAEPIAEAAATLAEPETEAAEDQTNTEQ